MTTTDLTREQILEMQAGPEMDFLIAVNVMRFSPTETPDDWTDERVVQCWIKPNVHCLISDPWQSQHQPEGHKHKWQHSWRMFQPSHDIATAWLAVEKMQNELMWSFSITGASPLSSVMCGIHAAFVKSVYPPNERNANDVICARGETAPLAICRAALLAKLSTPDKEG